MSDEPSFPPVPPSDRALDDPADVQPAPAAQEPREAKDDETSAPRGEAVNAETGEVTPSGDPLPPASESAYPADSVPLEPADCPDELDPADYPDEPPHHEEV